MGCQTSQNGDSLSLNRLQNQNHYHRLLNLTGTTCALEQPTKSVFEPPLTGTTCETEIVCIGTAYKIGVCHWWSNLTRAT